MGTGGEREGTVAITIGVVVAAALPGIEAVLVATTAGWTCADVGTTGTDTIGTALPCSPFVAPSAPVASGACEGEGATVRGTGG
mmetsp:Transcript_32568/g.66577  ORF Transcript_32568/g.66577 Transcript_32568/m.66577 type:complete len:84 (+) Transcript_32568:1258-1509(+)